MRALFGLNWSAGRSASRKSIPDQAGPRSKETMSLPEAASQSLAVLSELAVRIRVPSGLNAPYRTSKNWGASKEAISLPEAASQRLTCSLSHRADGEVEKVVQ